MEEEALALWDSGDDYETLRAAIMIESSLPSAQLGIIMDLCGSNTATAHKVTDQSIESIPGRPPLGSERRLGPGQFRHLLSVIDSNRHEVRYDMRAGRHPRHGLFPLAAMINHDCSPSCGFRTSPHDPNRLQIITYRPLSPGQEITISYLDDLHQPTHLRQAHLLRYFNFLCHCATCLSPSDKTRAFVCPQCAHNKAQAPGLLYPPIRTRQAASSSSSLLISPAAQEQSGDTPPVASWEPCTICGYQVNLMVAGLVQQTEAKVGSFEPWARCVEQLMDASSGLVPLAFHESHHLIQEAMYERCRLSVMERRGEKAYRRALGDMEACLRGARVEEKAHLYGWKAHVLCCLGRPREAKVAYRVAARMASRLHADGQDLYTALARDTPTDDSQLVQAITADHQP